MKELHKDRIRKVQQRLKSLGEQSALLVSSAPTILQNRDNQFLYRQSSDFYYLTGSEEKNLALLISTNLKSPLLFSPRPSKASILWDGKPLDLKSIAKKIGASPILCKDIFQEIRGKLRGIECLLYQNELDTLAWKIAKQLMELPSHSRGNYPAKFQHTDTVLEALRLKKDKYEIALISESAKRATQAFHGAAELVEPGVSERQVASVLDYYLGVQHCRTSFQTIVAGGSSAATLHHRPTEKLLRKNEMVLIDFGAEYQMYASDITRVIPISGTFNPLQKELYQIVYEAQQAALAKIKHGVLVETVYNAAAKVITEGLVSLGVLKGKVGNLLHKKAFLPYFPHGIGHSLGLDIHDIGALRSSQKARLESGMVLTIEPGLYFARKTKNIPSCGIRIEDDALVTKNGCQVLSSMCHNEAEEMEMLKSGPADIDTFA